jgi:hypothetical protein
MLINVELPSGITVKVDSNWFYSLSDSELKVFYENNTLSREYHQSILNPFDNSIIENSSPITDDFEELDTWVDIENMD